MTPLGSFVSKDGTRDASVAKVDTKLEIAVIPVSDIDRAKEFYGRLGWRLDADYDNGADFRVIQFTPPGSGCSTSPPFRKTRLPKSIAFRPDRG